MNVFKNIWRIVCYPLLYMGVQIVVTIIYMIILVFSYVIKLALENIDSGYDLRPEEIVKQFLTPQNVLIPLLISIIATLLIIFFMMRKEWKYNKLFRFGKLKASSVVICVFFGAAFSFFIDGVLTLLFELTKISVPEQPIDGLIGNNLILELLSIALLGPFIEEMIFRGIIQNRLLKLMGTKSAIILQAFIFGLIHLNILQSSYAFVIGIALGLIYLWSDSIWTAVTVHVLFNGTAVVMTHLAGETEIEKADLLYFVIISAAAFIVSAMLLYILYRQRKIKKVVYNRWAI